MERRHLLLAAMVAAAGLGAASSAVLVASDGDTRAAPTSVTVTLAQTATETMTRPATTAESGVPVPPLVGQRLDEASAMLQQARLRREVDGGGVFGVLDESAWMVCSTTPAAGDRVERDAVVVVHVDRAC
jgi:hypothetical protein